VFCYLLLDDHMLMSGRTNTAPLGAARPMFGQVGSTPEFSGQWKKNISLKWPLFPNPAVDAMEVRNYT
jgi:hypothetical protein